MYERPVINTIIEQTYIIGDNMEANESLDAVGLSCPMPIVKLAKRTKELNIGDVLELKVDDVGAKEDVPSWCKNTGNEYLGMEEEGSLMKFYIKKLE